MAETKENVFRVLVDYDLSLEDAVRAGNYDWIDGDINSKNFPSERRGKENVALELIPGFDLTDKRWIFAESAILALKQKGYRPANLWEGLAFGVANPDEQRKFPIGVRGSVWRNPYGHSYVPCLDGTGSQRCLLLRPIDDVVWFDRFLAVRESA